jgi:predicted nucleic acid-binding protein
LALLRRLPITPDANHAEAALLDLARRHRLTVYDAAYLELAHRERLALASLDDERRAAAGAEGITLLR